KGGILRVTQHVELTVSEDSRLYDTVQVRYRIVNSSGAPHTVGLRVMLEAGTIGSDGPPFFVPAGSSAFNYAKPPQPIVLAGKNIPDYVVALEAPYLYEDAGTAFTVGLADEESEPPEKIMSAAWPTHREIGWEWVEQSSPSQPRDSAVALYWAERNLQP